jgi:hypothetical protein
MRLTEYLDLILRSLLENHGVNTWPDGLKFLNSIDKGDSSTALRLLKEEGYIDTTSGVGWSISLTSKGAHFIMSGGYLGTENYERETLRNANTSRIVAIWSLVVAIIALGIAVISLLK